MPADTVCPYCQKHTHLVYVSGSARLVDERPYRIEAAFQCAACSRMIVGGHVRDFDEGMNFIHKDSRPDDLADYVKKEFHYLEPLTPAGREYTDIPTEIAAAASEAYVCASVGARRAALLMARTVVEASAKRHGVVSGRLHSKINTLAEKGLIRPVIADSAHAVRVDANAVAHGDFAEHDEPDEDDVTGIAEASVSAEDVEDILDLMDDILNELFSVPARAAKRRRDRASGATT